MPATILQPVAVLIAWTMVMLVWMLAVRLPAMSRAGIKLGALTGTKAADADRALPPEAQWKAHNYNHLLEQPVLFYAVCLTIALSGNSTGLTMYLAWAYVGLRILHSLWQATMNRVAVRFALFIASSLVLGLLCVRALMLVF